MRKNRALRAAVLVPVLAAAIALGGMPSARAQDAEAAPQGEADPVPVSPAEAPPRDIEAIEVTGERIDATDVQDEAQAITTFSAEDLDRANIVNVDSLAFSVPGLHVGQQGTAAIITLRGVGTENASLTGEPGVAFHVDGISYSRPSAARVAFFDLETLKVERGPQGLRGGKNSTSGWINLVTKKPHQEYEVSGDVLFGNYDRVRIRGAVNVPLTEFAAARLAVYHEDRDGYLDNVLVSDSRDPFDNDDFGLRGHLRLTPTDSLDLLVSYNYFRQAGNGAQADIVPADPRLVACSARTETGLANVPTVMPAGAACYRTESDRERTPIFDANGIFRGFQEVERGAIAMPTTEDGDPRKIYLDVPSAQDNRYWGFSSALDWSVPSLPGLGETRLKLIAGWQKIETSFNQDFDATDRAIFDYDLADFSQQNSFEAQWGGTVFDERFDWQAGFFWAWERASRDLATPGLGGQNNGVFSQQTTDNKAYGYALHTTFHVTDNVRFELGGRLVKDEKSTWLLRTVPSGGEDGVNSRFRGCTGSLGLTLGPPQRPRRVNVPCEATFRGNPWGTSIDWRPFGGDHLLYAKMDRGYKSGGFRAGTVGGYLPEEIWAYAVGTKSELFDRRLQLNLEGFFYSYDNMQLVVLDGLALRTENADARMYGWDLEAIGTPLPGLTLSAVVSFLKTETREYFSLDPANAENTFERLRLDSRDLADDLAAENAPGARPFEALDTCFSRAGQPANCGRLTPFGGLDDFSGNDLSRSPKWKFTLWAEYEIPLGHRGTLTPRIQYSWQDDTYFRAFNQKFDLQEAYHLTDFKLIWRSPEQIWTVEAFIQNIEDAAPKQNILVGPREFGAPPYAWYGPPRFYGMRVGYQF